MNHSTQKLISAVLIFAAGVYTAYFLGWTHSATAPAISRERPLPEITVSPSMDWALPETLTLCGERIPLEDRRVWEMLDREFHITLWDRAQVVMYLKRAERYFDSISSKLAAAGLPDDLKYLSVAESALITYSRSNKGARGPWQFMVGAARSNGLRRNRSIDERLNFEKSTDAAIRNLDRLHERFGSWALAMAAYNGGETRLRRAIEEQGTTDYYRLNLPIETERYLFRIAAIKIIMENPERYGYVLAEEELYRPIRSDAVQVRLNSSLDLAKLSAAVGTDYKELKERNPQFIKDFIPPGQHTLFVPAGSGLAALNYLNSESGKVTRAVLVRSERHRVERH
jgi:hypothetical protein